MGMIAFQILEPDLRGQLISYYKVPCGNKFPSLLDWIEYPLNLQPMMIFMLSLPLNPF